MQTGDNEFRSAEDILEEKRAEVLKKMDLAAMDWAALEEFAMTKLGTLPKEMEARDLVALIRLLDAEIASLQGSAVQGGLFQGSDEFADLR